jgi:hypothetical protein
MASCPGDKSAINEDPSSLVNRSQYSNNLTKSSSAYLAKLTAKSKCRQDKGFYPNFTPIIYNLSVTTSVHGKYSLVYINGYNFLPACNGITYVNFTNETSSYTKLPITFFSTSYLSFVVPIDAVAGNYSVVVVKVYNGNFSPNVHDVYPGILDYSNPLKYTLT